MIKENEEKKLLRLILIFIYFGFSLTFFSSYSVFSDNCNINLNLLNVVDWNNDLKIITNDPVRIYEILNFYSEFVKNISGFSYKKPIYLPVIFLNTLPTSSCENKVEDIIKSYASENGIHDKIAKLRFYFNKKNERLEFQVIAYDPSLTIFSNAISEMMKDVFYTNYETSIAKMINYLFIPILIESKVADQHIQVINSFNLLLKQLKSRRNKEITFYIEPKSYEDHFTMIGLEYDDSNPDVRIVGKRDLKNELDLTLENGHYIIYYSTKYDFEDLTMKLYFLLYDALVKSYIRSGVIDKVLYVPFYTASVIDYNEIIMQPNNNFYVLFYQSLSNAQQNCEEFKNLKKCYIVAFDSQQYSILKRPYYSIVYLPFTSQKTDLFEKEIFNLNSEFLSLIGENFDIDDIDAVVQTLEKLPLFYQLFVLAGVQNYINYINFSEMEKEYHKTYYDVLPQKLKDVLQTHRYLLREKIRNSATDRVEDFISNILSTSSKIKVDLQSKSTILKIIQDVLNCQESVEKRDFFDKLYYVLSRCVYINSQGRDVLELNVNSFFSSILNVLNGDFSGFEIKEDLSEEFPVEMWPQFKDFFARDFGIVKVDDKNISLYNLSQKLFTEYISSEEIKKEELVNYYINFSNLKSFVSTIEYFKFYPPITLNNNSHFIIETKSKTLVEKIKKTLQNLFELSELLKNPNLRIGNITINGHLGTHTKKDVCNFLISDRIKNNINSLNLKLIVNDYFDGDFDKFIDFLCEKSDVFEMIYFASEKQNIDPLLILSLIVMESEGKYNVGHTSYGLMQLSTYTYDYGGGDKSYNFDLRMYPPLNILIGVKFLKNEYLKKVNNLDIALYSYNFGPEVFKCDNYENFFERFTCVMKITYYITQNYAFYSDFFDELPHVFPSEKVNIYSCYLLERSSFDPSDHIFSSEFYNNQLFETTVSFREWCNVSNEIKTGSFKHKVKIEHEVFKILSQYFKCSLGSSTRVSTSVYETSRYAAKIMSVYILLRLAGIKTTTKEEFEYGLKFLYDELKSKKIEESLLYQTIHHLPD